MGKNHSKISCFEREEILKLKMELKYSLRNIAKIMGRHHSTISRELRRSGMKRNTYSLAVAQVDRNLKATHQGRKGKIECNKSLLDDIKKLMWNKRWSPEQVSAYLKKCKKKDWHVVHETIYKYIYRLAEGPEKEKWIKSLRQKRKKRRPKTGISRKHGPIPNRTSIHKRPQIVQTREEVGHWEGDLIVGKDHQSAVGTLVERKLRYVIIVSLPNGKTSEHVVKAFENEFQNMPPHMRKTLTYDNGAEMALHSSLKDMLGIDVYFADPGCPGQRGTNENTNGLIRDYFPKGTDFSTVSEESIKQVQYSLNDRPRKVLGYQTPQKLFYIESRVEPPDKQEVFNNEFERR